MNTIASNIFKIGPAGGAAVAGIGVGAAVDYFATKAPEQRRTIEWVTAGLGAATAVIGATVLHGAARLPVALLGAGTLLGVGASALFNRPAAPPAPGTPTPTPTPTGSTPSPTPVDPLPGELLPDGQQAAPRTVDIQGGKLRFDSVVGNTGAAPLQIALHLPKGDDKGSTTQVIYNENGTGSERPLQGGLRLDERADHDHLHFDDFVYFQLYKSDAHGRPKTSQGELAQGVKQSFYITDVQEFGGVSADNRAKADALAKHGRVDSSIVPANVHQGISVGYADVYGAGLEGQSLDVGNLAPGRYVLRESFDPNDEVREQNERNNVADTVIDVDRDQKVTIVSSKLAPESDYTTLKDGRQVIPEVVDSMAVHVHNHEDAVADQSAPTESLGLRI